MADTDSLDPAVVLYEALHDATCSEHGPHCEQFRAQVTDACRVAFWRLEEAGLVASAAAIPGRGKAHSVADIDQDMMIGTPDPAQGGWTVGPLRTYAHELWCEVAALRSRARSLESQLADSHLLLGEAFFLRQYGERPPGASTQDPAAETWAMWDRKAEKLLREIGDARWQ